MTGEAMSNQYSTMARVYDTWMSHDRPPYEAWTDAIDKVLQVTAPLKGRLLDVGCGTGAITERMADRAWELVGVDASPDMISIARDKSAGPEYLVRRLPDDGLADLGEFVGAYACFDTINYLSAPGQLATVFGQIGAALRPGSAFMFDTNTEFKLATLFSNYHSGDDFADEFGYVWKNKYSADTRCCHIEIIFFVRDESGKYDRHVERHVERWFTEAEVRDALAAGGMKLDRMNAAYSDDPVTPTSPRATWVAVKDG